MLSDRVFPHQESYPVIHYQAQSSIVQPQLQELRAEWLYYVSEVPDERGECGLLFIGDFCQLRAHQLTCVRSINNKTSTGNYENNIDMSERWTGRKPTAKASDSGLYWACCRPMTLTQLGGGG
ncbi:unnamed protein product [Pleuronectes platessa]|uniref:Uncharacterized protein n=1 Tax=Pleuronectes platessa TaxID=8262 RepID=A0A9N7YP46_PLEPL|nr:unnamed protein product [Pleuronectes platessa]